MSCKQPPYGGIRAIDLKTGKTLWDRPLGEARTNGPFGTVDAADTIGTPNNGGAVVTAGGLIFIAATTDTAPGDLARSHITVFLSDYLEASLIRTP
jgi:quinoprotein glucose dehydrogenase